MRLRTGNMTTGHIMQKELVHPITISVFSVLFVLIVVLTYYKILQSWQTALAIVLALFIASAIKIADQWEKAVVL